MNRYHKEVLFPTEYTDQLAKLNESFNNRDWSFSKHALENIQYRAIDMENLLKHIKNVVLNTEDIFEYYVTDGDIEKVCYRLEYDLYDYILVVDKYKKIITIYINSKDDKHYNLNKAVYATV